jgi:cell wall-associated NlpC family hydrolase
VRAPNDSQRRLIDAARSCLGVKWRHRGRTRKGLDCAGLPWLMYAECGVPLPDRRDYGRDPFREGLMSAIVEAVGPPVWKGPKGSCTRAMLDFADVVVMSPSALPRHVALIGDDLLHGFSLIHADGHHKAVIEHGMSSTDLNMIVAIFRRPLA